MRVALSVRRPTAAPRGRPTYRTSTPDCARARRRRDGAGRLGVGGAGAAAPAADRRPRSSSPRSMPRAAGGSGSASAPAGCAEEFEALDVPFERRGSRLEEWIALLRSCWTGSPRPARRPRVHAARRTCSACRRRPRPVPILLGGPFAAGAAAGRRDRRRLARAAVAREPRHRRDRGARRTAADAARVRGARPGRLQVVLRIVESAGRSAELAPRLPELAAAGVDEVIVDVDWALAIPAPSSSG